MSDAGVRMAHLEDASACAAIHNDWIDATSWMPRIHSRQEVLRYYQETMLPSQRVFVAGNPPKAYLALDDHNTVTALYSARPGTGLGKALLDHAKSLASELMLWTFDANTRAQRFYAREGFTAVKRTDGDNEEGLPDILYRWEADHA